MSETCVASDIISFYSNFNATHRRTSVLLDDADSLLEEVAKGSDTVFLGDEHDACRIWKRKHENLGCFVVETTDSRLLGWVN